MGEGVNLMGKGFSFVGGAMRRLGNLIEMLVV